ncbi:tRNA (adenine(22)-N(1))-methyltransferase [Paraliomyxa miuraensis]|uniref:tRNA (adenine(22)-N(1))-methyltransferase n=1 Tax=Paraliomyxa miuraensis TaxID=376150 RepID=UPI002252105E|nr:class I SAM-dependent methyltransferase [Paraliomyxa miuraensis]MCX4247001.1 class I SAM-dependent methyltransferase [Paraliomyxa miuraensis]
MPARLRPLSARLHAVAQAIPPGSRVADVGTDHAQLLAWLRARGRIAAGIGIDVVPGPLEHARRTLTAAGIEGVELRQGDGLAPLSPGEIDVVVLAGMGGARIVRLLQAQPARVEGLRALVLQPNTDWIGVRRLVAERGWRLTGERMVEDRGKFYVVLTVTPRRGPASAWSDDALVLGPRLLADRAPTFVAWLRHELARTERALVRAGRAHDRCDVGPSPREVALRTHAERLHRVLSAP